MIVSMNPIPTNDRKPPADEHKKREVEEVFLVEVLPRSTQNLRSVSKEEMDENAERLKWVMKYKPVAKRKRPVPNTIPEGVKVIRKFPSDPLGNLPQLPSVPPDFKPTKRITSEQMNNLQIEKNTDLTTEEAKLLQYILVLNERSIAFAEEERGTFRQDYFSDYQMPVMEHEPWKEKNIPLPPGYREEILRLLKEKIDAGVYEPAQSSY